jgi:hypothetical protein
MGEWRQTQKHSPTAETERAAQKRFRNEINAMPKSNLQRAAAEWRRKHEARQEPPHANVQAQA